MRLDTELQANIEVLYDSECPICNHYACALGDSPGIKTIDARKPSARLQQAKKSKLNIDLGSIVYAGDDVLFGTEAFVFLARHGRMNGVVGFLNRVLFRHRSIAKILYPMLVLLRRLLLKILHRPLIESKLHRGKTKNTLARNKTTQV